MTEILKIFGGDARDQLPPALSTPMEVELTIAATSLVEMAISDVTEPNTRMSLRDLRCRIRICRDPRRLHCHLERLETLLTIYRRGTPSILEHEIRALKAYVYTPA